MRESRAARVEIRLLGEFGVCVDGCPVPPCAWQTSSADKLVKMLAIAPGHQRSREEIARTLWGHADPDGAEALLQKAVGQARALLGGTDALVLSGREVALATAAGVDVDLDRFELEARRALESGSRDDCVRAAALYGGELLPSDRYADWTEPRREHARGAFLELVRRAGATLEANDERAAPILMRLYATSGRRAAALRLFRRLHQSRGAEPFAAPSRETLDLHAELAHGPSEAVPTPPSLTGRQKELAAARTLWRRVCEGDGATLLVRGAAGVGKTRLVEALLAEAASEGTALRSRAGTALLGTSFGVIVGLLEQLLCARPDVTARLPAPVLRLLSRLASAGSDEPVDRQALLAAVTQVLAVSARERPVLLFVDDLEAADESSLALLGYLARATRCERVLLVAALRPEPRATLEQLRASLLASGTALELELELLHRASQGAPAELEPELRAGLERAAVLGDGFTCEEFLGFADAPEAAAFELLQRARRKRWLEAEGAGFRFRQRRLREALLRQLAPERRAELEAAAALVLGRCGASAGRIAEHLLRAARPAEAARWLEQAARDELAAAAHESALRWLELGVERGEAEVELLGMRAELLAALDDERAPAALDEALRHARGPRRESLRLHRSRVSLASGDLRTAARFLAEIGEIDAIEERVRQLLLRSELECLRGDLGSAERFADQALTLARQLGPGRVLGDAVTLRMRVAHRRGYWTDLARAQLLEHERSSELAASIHEGHLCVAQSYLYGSTSYARVSTFARELLGAAERSNSRRATAFALCLLGESELVTGELAAAQQHLERAQRLCAELGVGGAEALALERLARTALESGEPERARELLATALERARHAQSRRHLLERVYGTWIRAEHDARRALGALDEAEAALSGPDTSCASCAVTLSVPAALACARGGAPERAARYLAEAERSTSLFWRGTTWEAAVDEARAVLAVAQGDRARAHELYVRAAHTFARAGQKLDAARCRRLREAL